MAHVHNYIADKIQEVYTTEEWQFSGKHNFACVRFIFATRTSVPFNQAVLVHAVGGPAGVEGLC